MSGVLRGIRAGGLALLLSLLLIAGSAASSWAASIGLTPQAPRYTGEATLEYLAESGDFSALGFADTYVDENGDTFTVYYVNEVTLEPDLGRVGGELFFGTTFDELFFSGCSGVSECPSAGLLLTGFHPDLGLIGAGFGVQGTLGVGVPEVGETGDLEWQDGGEWSVIFHIQELFPGFGYDVQDPFAESWTMTDVPFTVFTNPPQPVPEPAAGILLGTALGLRALRPGGRAKRALR